MFRSARLKLTGWYLLIIMLISMSFSIVIYRGLTTEVERLAQAQKFLFERRLRGHFLIPVDPTPLVDTDLVNETKQRIRVLLFLINSSILFASGGLAYLLASRTLEPIQKMVEEQNRFISDASHE